MEKEKSVGAIVFRKEGRKIYYLLLNYGKGYWGFPKGRQEKGESDEETARREIEEETGIKSLEFIKGFREKIRYYFKRKKGDRKVLVYKEAVFYLANTNQKKVKISFEHEGFGWFPFKEAFLKTTFKNAKEALKRADEFLRKKGGVFIAEPSKNISTVR